MATTTHGAQNYIENPSPPSIILYPSPGMGHLVSMVELAKLFLSHGLQVTVLAVEPPYNTGDTAAFIAHATTSNPSLHFHRLPAVVLPPNSSPNHEDLALALLRLSNPNLRSFLASQQPRALVADFFCGCALEVANELGIPCYFFFTSGASFTASFLHLPAIHRNTTKSFAELGPELVEFPGIPAIPGDHMPMPMLDREYDAYKGFIYACERYAESAGIIVNTFEALEPTSIAAIKAGKCVPAGKTTPKLYAIGPLINTNRKQAQSRHECLNWLDAQPKSSVVFLCFGSLGVFSAAQLQEIAAGLESSGHRFLWVVKSPPRPGAKWFEKAQEPELNELLPAGFLERTEGRGLVVKSWAPQVEVLNHGAIGAFVTHLGWNSVLEGITAGVPMVGWPLYAEQRMNKVFLGELKLVAVVEGYDKELVMAEEVEMKVKWVMESTEAAELRARIKALKTEAAIAVGEGGSSNEAVMELVKDVRIFC